jgi:uncharacterized protein (DUF433 family)
VNLRELPNYRLPEAAHYLRVPLSTLRSWTGQAIQTWQELGPAPGLIKIPDRNGEPPRLSFVNMVEAHVLSGIRYQHGVPLPAVRRAVDYLAKKFGSSHPLADEDLQPDGVNLFVERLGLLNVSAPGQYAMQDILAALLRRVERDEHGLAVRLYPFSRRPALAADSGLAESPRSVVMDPRVAFGRPVLVGTGVTTLSIAERFDAGEEVEELAADYGRPAHEIFEALRCEMAHRDAA